MLGRAMQCHAARMQRQLLAAQEKEQRQLLAAQEKEQTARAVLYGALGSWLARKCLARYRAAARHAAAAAAACLQGAFRGRAARWRAGALRELERRRHLAAVTVGRWVRGHQGRRYARDARQAAAEQGLFLERYRLVRDESPRRVKGNAPRQPAAALVVRAGNGPNRQLAKGQGPVTRVRPVRADKWAAEAGRHLAAEASSAAGGEPGRTGSPRLGGVKDGVKDCQFSSQDTRAVKDGGRLVVAGLLAGQRARWDRERDGGGRAARPRMAMAATHGARACPAHGWFAAVDLKTRRHVLIRILADTRQFERERQLQAVLDPRCPAALVPRGALREGWHVELCCDLPSTPRTASV